MSAFHFNGFLAGDTPATFIAFCVSPVCTVAKGTDAEAIEVCGPELAEGWSIYGETYEGARLVHDDNAGDIGRALVALVATNPAPIYYQDDQDRTLPGTLDDLAARLSEKIHDEITGYDDPEDFRDDDFDAHPLANLRELICDAIEERAAA